MYKKNYDMDYNLDNIDSFNSICEKIIVLFFN